MKSKKEHRRMGVNAGLTKVFNISRKLRLSDKVTLRHPDTKEGSTRTVETWIRVAPEFIYHATLSGKAPLVTTAYAELKKVLRKKRPDLLEISKKNKLSRRLREKFVKKAANSKELSRACLMSAKHKEAFIKEKGRGVGKNQELVENKMDLVKNDIYKKIYGNKQVSPPLKLKASRMS